MDLSKSNSYGNRMSANNDGMDPDWKPSNYGIPAAKKYIDLDLYNEIKKELEETKKKLEIINKYALDFLPHSVLEEMFKELGE